jgi:hypothetical protein
MKTIPLTQGRVAVVDDKDYDVLALHKWCLDRIDGQYAVAKIDGRVVSMHRRILRIQRGRRVDHIDGDGLNNQRANLRKCTHRQNCQNRRGYGRQSRFTGVTAGRREGTWRAQAHGEHIGTFGHEVDAAAAYDAAAVREYGAFARPNFPFLW